ncbi:MAG: hypothetical protein ACTSU2_06465 [Promethearchaeota archaeon]
MAEENYDEDIGDIYEMEEDLLAELIVKKRDLPYTLKIERIDPESNEIHCRNAWGNRVLYIFKDNNFFLRDEL